MNAMATSGPRVLLRRLHDVMAGPGDVQSRLDQIVRSIAANMVAEVCSVYFMREDVLELVATEGLNAEAVHKTTLHMGEGLVGLIAQQARAVALSDAQSHPNFAYRPETGEEVYHSLMGVPILRAGRVIGVLVVQNRTMRDYTDEEVEAMQTIAMVLAEMANAALRPSEDAPAPAPASDLPFRISGLTLNEGLARGVIVLHEPLVVVEQHVAQNIEVEKQRMDQGLEELRTQIDGLLSNATPGGEPTEILQTYRMFANDRGWITRLYEAVESGLTAEAAVERVQVDTRARMSQVTDPFLRERLHDLEDLANRLLRHLTGRVVTAAFETLPEDAIIVARNMGPAELLEYDRGRLRALLLEEGTPASHVAIVARALQIPVIGLLDRLLDRVEPGDTALIDADNGQVFVRPSDDVRHAFEQNLSLREAQEAEYASHREEPATTRDGTQVRLNINAGLLVDLPQLDETGADGIGLYRTELHFMVRASLPNISTQAEFYGRVLTQANGRPVVFRTLDVGGDKVLPYLRRYDDENPAMGWRAIRLALDRPVLLRMQLRALIKAAAGHELNVMFPMIAEVAEFAAAKELLDREVARWARLNEPQPSRIRVGTMLEVPSLAWQLPALLPIVDFVSIGSNDLMQFLFASDRGNPRLSGRYDVLSPAALSFLRDVVRRCDDANVAVSLCGEAAGHPVDAMALIGLGLRDISMTPAAVGRVKVMVQSLDLPPLQDFMETLYDSPLHSVRDRLVAFAADQSVAI